MPAFVTKNHSVIRIAQISDCHLFADVAKAGYANIAPYHSLASVLQNIATRQIDLLLITGDLSADGSAQSYVHFKNLLDQHAVSSKYVILPGNHDDTATLKQQFCAQNLWLHYPSQAPLTLGNWQIHLLNTKTVGTGGHISTQDLARLAQSLTHHQDYFQVVAAHHHPIPCDSWMDAHGWQNGAELVTILQTYSSVKAMIYGHIHAASEQVFNACIYLSCPSTCWQWAMQAEFGLSEQGPGYRLLELTDGGHINTTIIRVGHP